MILLVLIIFATIFYTLFDFFASRAGGQLDPNFSAVLFNGIGTLIPFVLYGFYKLTKGSQLLPTTKSGAINSILAGISIAIFSILLIKIFEKGGLSYVVPLIYGGTIVLATLLGWLVSKDQITAVQGWGIVVIAVGVGMVALGKLHV
jgi:uncharacterized membrane protein